MATVSAVMELGFRPRSADHSGELRDSQYSTASHSQVVVV